MRPTPEKVRARYDAWSRYYDLADKFPVLSKPGRERRIKAVEILRIQENETVLEVGCGTGEMIFLASEIEPRARFIALDFSRKMLLRTREKTPACDPLLADLEMIPLRSNSVDKVIAAYTFTSVPRPEPCIKEVYRVMKPGARASILDTARPHSLFWRGVTWPSRAIAKIAGYTYMDREILPLVKKYFRVVKIISYSGGFVWCALIEK
jgi:ubiquinone/menaquinone biosynthesis C-methylase UbiE